MFVGLACNPTLQPVRLTIHTQSNDGQAIEQASVFLDDKKIGATDALGRVTIETHIPTETLVHIEIRKTSDTHYFAPFKEDFRLPKMKDEEAEPRITEHQINATLYAVPKPEPELAQMHSSLAITPPANQTPDSPKEITPSQSDLSQIPFNQQETIKENPDPSSNSAPTTNESANNAANALADNSAVDISESLENDPRSIPANAAVSSAPIASTAAPAANTEFLLTVHALNGTQPLADAEVRYGYASQTDLRLGCQTNARGRCVLRLQEKPFGLITLVIRKSGYRTKTIESPILEKIDLRIQLERGQSLDIYAATRTYGMTSGVKGVEVLIDNKHAGFTDSFGHYSHLYSIDPRKPVKAIQVKLKPTGYLPEVTSTDIVPHSSDANSNSIVQFFNPIKPPSRYVAIAEAKVVGSATSLVDSGSRDKFFRSLRASLAHQLFDKAGFREYPWPLFEKSALHSQLTISSLIEDGWRTIPSLSTEVNALLVPTIFAGATPFIELNLVDSYGRILSASSAIFKSPEMDLNEAEHLVDDAIKDLLRFTPYEGTILPQDPSTKAADDSCRINLGQAYSIRVGDSFDVLAASYSETSALPKPKARILAQNVGVESTQCRVQYVDKESKIQAGDLIQRRRELNNEASSQIILSDPSRSSESKAVAKANIYYNGNWLGSTDEQGRLFTTPFHDAGNLLISKSGYQYINQNLALIPNQTQQLELRRESLYLHLESKPTAVSVMIDNKLVGKTPLKISIPLNEAGTKVELQAPSGYKPFAMQLNQEQTHIDRTGAHAIQLETDYLTNAARLVQSGKLHAALRKYAEIPITHSDYLQGRQEAGMLYLTQLDQPSRAAEAFGLITAHESVKGFRESKFLLTYLDEAMALMLTGDKLAQSQADAALAHYKKAASILDGLTPHLQPNNEDKRTDASNQELSQAAHKLGYHRALVQHKIWLLTADANTLSVQATSEQKQKTKQAREMLRKDTVRRWHDYLNSEANLNSEAHAPRDSELIKSYVEDAQTHLRQASSSGKAGAASSVR